MAISFRTYLFQESGALKRIPQSILQGLVVGENAIPEYAGTRQRVGEFVVELQDRKPARIIDGKGTYWDFDKDGKIDASLWRSAAAYTDLLELQIPRTKGAVVDLVPQIKRKQVDEKHRWPLTSDDFARVAADLWPGINGPKPEVGSVKGSAPKRPPLSYDAKRALDDIDTSVTSIINELDALPEAGLKGLEFEARRMATCERPSLWNGIADEAKKRRELLAVRRTGKGEWYAVVEMTVDDPDGTTHMMTAAYEKCPSQAVALEAGKRLMREHVDRLSPRTRMEVSVYSVLEWQPEAG